MKVYGEFKGNLTIGDGMYLDELKVRENEGMRKLVFNKNINSSVELTVIDVEDEHPVAVATIHFYNKKKRCISIR